jgi:cell filamentation protein
MYAAPDDPYCYSGTTVLKNLADLRTQPELDAFEAAMVTQRLDEPLPSGRLGYAHYRAVHHHLFGDVYDWAGRIRIVRIIKGASIFCYPEHIEGEMRRLFSGLRELNFLRDTDMQIFSANAAHFLSELNAIHPFREGNGRTQLAFLAILADAAGHPVNYGAIDPQRLLQAMIASFGGDEEPLTSVIASLLAP